jgi:hypothetical protein
MPSDKIFDSPITDSPRERPTPRRRIGRRKQRIGREQEVAGLAPSLGREEVLVADDRAELRPAQVVESKLTRLLQEATVPVSHLQMRGLLKAR